MEVADGDQQKLVNAGELKAERMEKFKKFLEMGEKYRRVMNKGEMKEERVERLTIVDFRHDSTMIKRAYHCARCSESLENFWK